MIFYYGTELSPNQLETQEGYLICKNVPISRTGTQEYSAKDLEGISGDPTRVITVIRKPEDVFEIASMASFEGKAVTDDHPNESVTTGNHNAFARGHVQNVRRSGDFVVADLHISDECLISDIKNKLKIEVSCGYTCSWEWEGDILKQVKIRGNHVAIVPKGRAGATVAIKDSAETAGKGNAMATLSRAILKAFGLAVKDANPKELDELVEATENALDAVPAEKAQEAAPAKDNYSKEEKMETKDMKTKDVKVESIPKGDDIGSKLDKLIEMMGEVLKKEDKEEKVLRDESDIDELIEKLAGGEVLKKEDKEEKVLRDESDIDELIEKLAGGEGEEMETDEAKTIPSDDVTDMDTATKDAAMAILKKVRPAIAGIKDSAEKSKITDAFLSAMKSDDTMSKILGATQANARKNVNDAISAHDKHAKMCEDQKKLYDSRNPHKRKEG